MRLSGRLFVLLPCALVICATIGAPHFAALERATASLFAGTDEAAPVHARQDPPTAAIAEQDPVTMRLRPSSESRRERPVDDVEHVTVAIVPEGRGVLLTSMYGSFLTLQALDVHSTRRAVALGGTEVNPIMSPFANNTPAMAAMKFGTAAGVIYMTERIRVRNRVAAIAMMAAFNSAYAVVVSHNYRLISRAR
jgi:hypothetical protein